jgi:hypothetical protein
MLKTTLARFMLPLVLLFSNSSGEFCTGAKQKGPESQTGT